MNSTEKVKKCKTCCFIGCSEPETQTEKNSLYMTKRKLIQSFKLEAFYSYRASSHQQLTTVKLLVVR